MDILPAEVTLHPELFHLLFANKFKTWLLFHNLLAAHKIDHLAIYLIDRECKLLCFSSSPALEYNLFNSPLWRFDRSFHPAWYKQGGIATWQSLYCPSRYDELYYLKQIKPHYPWGLSLATTTRFGDVVFSIATHNDGAHLQQQLQSRVEQFYDLGQQCLLELSPLLPHADPYLLQSGQK